MVQGGSAEKMWTTVKKRTNVKKERGGVDLGAAETSWTGVGATVGSMGGFRLWWSSRCGGCGGPLHTTVAWCCKWWGYL